ncbi:hypothetical protein [Arcanobacterium buesumense]|uniref:Uncharacterized protein n=1 Tax=Arcanobacterium buesumense TaxID=2722751 RepID=A0A6H2EI42_9ACTO|nr:hypothetical protein [Arcanobacterium buesumense]QJC21235.1 hypothetical protein HC352_00990 [Arcanobacterium buesumense]
MLATAAALSLSACHSSLDIDVNPSGNISSVIYINDDEGILATLGGGETCDDLLTTVRVQANQSNDDIQVEDTSTAGNAECRFSSASDGSFIKGKNLLETDDTYILKIDAIEDIQPDQTQMLDSAGTFSLTITMPDDIIKAEGAEIHGNLATFTSFSSIANGVFVEGLKEDPKASTSTGATT